MDPFIILDKCQFEIYHPFWKNQSREIRDFNMIWVMEAFPKKSKKQRKIAPKTAHNGRKFGHKLLVPALQLEILIPEYDFWQRGRLEIVVNRDVTSNLKSIQNKSFDFHHYLDTHLAYTADACLQ